MFDKIIGESIMIPINGTDKLHLRRIYKNETGTPVFMIHGAIENGKIFYSDSGKGLAYYLAQKGYDVYAGDLRGKGESSPPITHCSLYGQTEAIIEDIPAFIDTIIKIRGQIPQYWIAHSWGGVLLNSYLARFNKHRNLVKKIVYFGTKRTIKVINIKRFFIIEGIWKFLSQIIIMYKGFLDLENLGIGSDKETKKFYFQCLKWVKPSPWVDSDDNFDYGSAIKKIKLPPVLYLAGAADACLGHPNDVHDFMMESGAEFAQFRILGKKYENLHDYGHIDMLVHPDAVKDHFPLVIEWFEKD